MIAKTLRDMLSVYYHCKNVHVSTRDYASGYFARRPYLLTPSMVFNVANREGAVYKSYSNKKWHEHLNRKVTFIDTDAEAVEIPVAMLFDLVESVYNDLSLPYMARVRRSASISDEVDWPHTTMVLDKLMWEVFQTWARPRAFHLITFKDTKFDASDLTHVREKITKSFHKEVAVSEKIHAHIGDTFVVVPKDANESLSLCMNRLKISLGKTGEEIMWNMVVEDGVCSDELKSILDTLLECTPREVLNYRLP